MHSAVENNNIGTLALWECDEGSLVITWPLIASVVQNKFPHVGITAKVTVLEYSNLNSVLQPHGEGM